MSTPKSDPLWEACLTASDRGRAEREANARSKLRRRDERPSYCCGHLCPPLSLVERFRHQSVRANQLQDLGDESRTHDVSVVVVVVVLAASPNMISRASTVDVATSVFVKVTMEGLRAMMLKGALLPKQSSHDSAGMVIVEVLMRIVTRCSGSRESNARCHD